MPWCRKHISQKLFEIGFLWHTAFHSVGIDLDVNPIAVPSYIGSYRFQLSSDQGAISTGITGGIENLDGRVMNPIGVIRLVLYLTSPFLAILTKERVLGEVRPFNPANGIQIDFLPVQVDPGQVVEGI